MSGAGLLAMTLVVGAPAPEMSPAPAATPAPAPATAARGGDEVVPRAAVVRTVTLADVLAQARAHDAEAMRAESRVALGVAERAAAAPLLPSNPSIYLGVGGRANPLGMHLELQAQVSQPLEIAGERRMRRRAAAARHDALAQHHALAQWQAEVEARAAFQLALVERRRAEMAATVEAFSRSVVDTTEALVRAGEESPLRLRLARAELSQARQARHDAEQRYRAACSRLAERVGWPVDEDLQPQGELPTPIDGSVDAPEHPAVAAMEAEVAAAQAAVAAARRDAWPHPSVGVYVARERERGTPWASRVALATLSLPLPLWHRNQGARARAQARLRIASTERALVERQLARERRRAQDAVDTAVRRLAIYADEVLPRLSDNLVLVQRAFELGEIDLLEVLVARERFLRLQDEALDVYVDYIEATRDLALAAGGSLAGAGG